MTIIEPSTDRGLVGLDLLDRMLDDLRQAPERYRPTNFWASGLQPIVDDLRLHGVERFRRHPSARRMFVPSYTNGRRWVARSGDVLARVPVARQIGDRLVRNVPRAEADLRVLLAADRPTGPDLSTVQESTVGDPPDQLVLDGRRFSKSMLNYLRGLAMLKQTVDTSDLGVVLEIGGGYGTLGEILAQAAPGSLYVDVDIPPVAFVATWYLQSVLGAGRVLPYDEAPADDSLSLDDLRGRVDAAVLCSWQIEQLVGQVDLFVNYISFQEMEPEVVENYARQVERLAPRHLLLRNSASGKRVVEPGEVGVITPTVTTDYLRFFPSYRLVRSDALVFGEVLGQFVSEVLILERRS